MNFSGILIPAPTYVVLELAAVFTALVMAFILPEFGSAWFQRSERFFLRIAKNRKLAIVLCGLSPLILRLSLLPWKGLPEPALQEDFSYLLSADTFASGRLANPPHPMAIHLETLQVLQNPTYSSFRPPGQGVFLALGQVLTKYPWAGVLLSVGAFCAALCWMLQGWFPPGWALLGGMLAVIRIGVFTFWANSYSGGAVAALGGVLVLGALPRIKHRISLLDVFWMAIGIGLLFTTRTYEGLFVLVPVAVDLALWLTKKDSWGTTFKIARFVLPMMFLLAIVFGWVAYYNWRVTGVPTDLPYVVGRKQYAMVGSFVWQPLQPPPVYHHAMIKKFFAEWEVNTYHALKSHRLFVRNALWSGYSFWEFYIRPTFTLPLLWLLWAWKDRKIRIFIIMMAIASVGLVVETWFNNFYAAPLTGAIFAIVLQCMRHMRLWRLNGRPVGLFLARSTVVICIAMFFALVFTFVLGFRIRSDGNAWASDFTILHDRVSLLAQLERLPGRHLVIVRYSPDHNPHHEWIFNTANIDRSKVVWAQDMGRVQNQELINYFRGRRVWLVEPDRSHLTLEPYCSAPLKNGH